MAYEEFSMLADNAAEVGLPFAAPPAVRRESWTTPDRRTLSALVWGTSLPEVVLLHGGGQNAHTWDTVLLALNRPALAIDLPGHGHSDGPAAGRPLLIGYAEDVAGVIRSLAPDAEAVVGMSLGGQTSIMLASIAPDLVRRLVLVDILPGRHSAAAQDITDFLDGPETFASFDEILDQTIRFNPTRTASSLRRGILHNAVELEDGRWQWRHRRHRARFPPTDPEESERRSVDQWERLAASTAPLLLVRGMAAGSVLTDDQVATMLRLRPNARVAPVEDAGHSVQGDQPLELARLIAGHLLTPLAPDH